MKMVKNSLLVLLLSVVVSHSSINAQSYPLSPESTQYVAVVTTIAALVTGGLGYAVGQECTPEYYGCTKEERKELKASYKWKVAICCAAVGALLVGAWAYYNTPEKLLEWVEKNLADLKDTHLMSATLSAQSLPRNQAIAEIENVYFDSEYPARASVNGLQALYRGFSDVKSYLVKVANSCISPVSAISRETLVDVNHSQNALQKAMTLMKNNPNYATEKSVQMQEVAFRESMRFMRKTAASQAQMADAASMHAAAAMTNATARAAKVTHNIFYGK